MLPQSQLMSSRIPLGRNRPALPWLGIARLFPGTVPDSSPVPTSRAPHYID